MSNWKRLALGGAAQAAGALAKGAKTQTAVFNALRLNRPEIKEFVFDDDLRFLAYCLARRERSRAQILQDLWVCFELGEKEGGFFVEFGSTNGLTNSNTWLLEQMLNWKGILAEPNPVWHADLAANRRAQIEHKCVSSKSGEIVSFITADESDPELSGMADFADADHFAETRGRSARIQVETISLNDLLDKYKAPPIIDYISIDTEGSEYDILSAFDFTRKLQLISVENNPVTEQPIHDLLVSKGYQRVFKRFSQWDSWYVSAELRDQKKISIVAPKS